MHRSLQKLALTRTLLTALESVVRVVKHFILHFVVILHLFSAIFSCSMLFLDATSLSGPKPLDLYGRFTWKIEKFSTINKKELRSNAFEVGGYKWYGFYLISFIP